jgi:hypothetical protein
MTERKPPDVPFESWIDRQIQEAAERGEFDNLPGAGKPLPGFGGADDEDWWLRSYVRREGVPTEALLPPSLQLRKEIELLPDTVRDLDSEAEVREVVARLNKRVMDFWRSATGPQVPVRLANADNVVERWRTTRSAEESRPAAAPETPIPAAAPEPVPWWRRLGRRFTTGAD